MYIYICIIYIYRVAYIFRYVHVYLSVHVYICMHVCLFMCNREGERERERERLVFVYVSVYSVLYLCMLDTYSLCTYLYVHVIVYRRLHITRVPVCVFLYVYMCILDKSAIWIAGRYMPYQYDNVHKIPTFDFIDSS